MLPGLVGTGFFGSAASAGPYGTHRYWFLAISNNAGDASFTATTEIEFLDAGGSVISTAGGTAFSGGAGSDGVGAPASEAFDGVTSGASEWQRTSATGVLIGMDFGAGNEKAVAGVRIRSASSGLDRSPGVWALRYSDSAVTALTDGTQAFAAGSRYWVASEQRTFPEVFATGVHRAWRLFISTVNGGTRTCADEIELRATVGGADQTAAVTGNLTDTDGRVIYSADAAGNDAWRAWDNAIGSAGSSTWLALAAPNQYIGIAIPGGIAVGEVALTAGTFATHSPRSTKLEYWDEATSAWVQQGSSYDWGAWTVQATRTHSF